MEVSITGARIYFEIPILGGIPITETIVNSWLVMLAIIGLCLFLTHDLKVRNVSKRQVVAEMLVTTAQNFVNTNMGEKFAHYGPFVAALFASSLLSNLLSLIGMFPPTSDLSTTLAWAVLVFVLITATKIRTSGVLGYMKGFTQLQHPVRAGHADLDGVPSLRQHRVRRRHLGACVCGARVAVQPCAGAASGSSGRHSVPHSHLPGGYPGSAVRVF